MGGRAVFFYDFNSPYAWLAAERIESLLPERPVWKPISYGHVIQHTGVLPWSMKPGREADMREIDRRAGERGLGPVRWSEGWPRYSTLDAAGGSVRDRARQGRRLLAGRLQAAVQRRAAAQR